MNMFSSERSSDTLYPSRRILAAAEACCFLTCHSQEQQPVTKALRQQKPTTVGKLTVGSATAVVPCQVDATVISAAPLGILTRTASDGSGSRSRGHLCDPGTTMAAVVFSVRETP